MAGRGDSENMIKREWHRYVHELTADWIADRINLMRGKRIINVASGQAHKRRWIELNDCEHFWPELFEDEDFTSLDRLNGSNADIIQPVEEYAWTDGQGQYDVVIATHFLEHAPDPVLMTEYLTVLLKKGGLLFLVCPFAQPVHTPKDYWRFNTPAMEFLFEHYGFKNVVIDELGEHFCDCGEPYGPMLIAGYGEYEG